MPDIPAFAVLNTSAELAKKHNHKGLVAYVNGVLRNYSRKNQIQTATPIITSEQSTKELSVSYSIPEWLIKRWLQNYGQQEMLVLLNYFNKQPDIVLRTNRQLNSTAVLADLLQSKNIATRTVIYCQIAWLLKPILQIRRTNEGPLEVVLRICLVTAKFILLQDEPSAFAAHVLSPEPGDLVVDLCAAPGNKTLYLAELMQNQGHILAIDKNKKGLNT